MSTSILTPAISQEAALTTSSKAVASENPNRSYLFIKNTSDVNVSIAFGTAAISGSGITLSPGEPLHINVDRRALADEGWKTLGVYAVAASGSAKTLSILDASFPG
jgi:hypothetical protein